MTLNTTSVSPQPGMKKVSIDMDTLRAHLVSAIKLACKLFEKDNLGIKLDYTLNKISEMEVLFNLELSNGATRIYRLQLISPDGSKANLAKFGFKEEKLEFDNFDNAFVKACGMALPLTVGVGFKEMIPPPKTATHPQINTIH